MVEVLTFINDHRGTLSSRSANLFKTPMLQAIEGANPEGVAAKSKRSVKQMSVSEITKQVKKICKASRDLPSWYHDKIASTSPTRKGEVVVHELKVCGPFWSVTKIISIVKEPWTSLPGQDQREPSPAILILNSSLSTKCQAKRKRAINLTPKSMSTAVPPRS